MFSHRDWFRDEHVTAEKPIRDTRLNSETFAELLEKWAYFPSARAADSHLATTIQREMVGSTERWRKTVSLSNTFKPPCLKFHPWTFQLHKPEILLQYHMPVGVLFQGQKNPD